MVGRAGAGAAAPAAPAQAAENARGDLARLQRRLSADSQGPLLLGAAIQAAPPGARLRRARARRRAFRARSGG